MRWQTAHKKGPYFMYGPFYATGGLQHPGFPRDYPRLAVVFFFAAAFFFAVAFFFGAAFFFAAAFFFGAAFFFAATFFFGAAFFFAATFFFVAITNLHSIRIAHAEYKQRNTKCQYFLLTIVFASLKKITGRIFISRFAHHVITGVKHNQCMRSLYRGHHRPDDMRRQKYLMRPVQVNNAGHVSDFTFRRACALPTAFRSMTSQ
jgi:hypothetical protein